MIVEVIYATITQQVRLSITLDDLATIQEVIHQSNILKQCPEINLEQASIGIWGKIKPLNTLVSEGDRIEIYRPLTIDPMEARRLRVKKKNLDCHAFGSQ